MANRKAVKAIENMNIQNSEGLCKLAEMIGYRHTRFGQLQFSNGAFASSLLAFFDDNPGAIEAVSNFVVENIDSYEIDEDCTEGDEAEEEEEDTDEAPVSE